MRAASKKHKSMNQALNLKGTQQTKSCFYLSTLIRIEFTNSINLPPITELVE